MKSIVMPHTPFGRIPAPRLAVAALATLLPLVAALPLAALPPGELPRALAAPDSLARHPESAYLPPVDGEGVAGSLTLSLGSTGFGAPAPDFADRAIVLCWHSFLGDPSLPTDFSLAELGRQLDAIAALGYRFASLDELLYGRVEGPLTVVVTLDDGHRTVPAAIEKVFAPRGIVPALFLYPAVIGTTGFSLGDEAARRLSATHPIGAHGYHHLFVTDDLKTRDREAYDREIRKAKEKTEALSSRPVLVYAYPFGAYSPGTGLDLGEAGYAFGFAVKPGFVFADQRLNESMALPRLVVTRENWPTILAALSRSAAAARAGAK